MLKQILIFVFCLWLSNNLNGQSKRIKVVDSLTGQPLTAATAKIFHGALHFKSDKNGEFSLLGTEQDDTLIISYIGYKPYYLPVGAIDKNPFIVKMVRSNGNLEDVSVSTGYQTIPKDRATGSFYKINKQKLDQRVSANILDRIENIAPGIIYDRRNTSEPYKIQIRGLSTLTDAIAQPLIVVNNFPFTGDINSINPDDVKDITILRDAAAASIWGAKAGNGVIVITLKKASAGQRKISFNSTMTFKGVPDLLNDNQISVSDYIDVEEFLFNKGFYSWKFNNPSYPAITPVVDILHQQEEGLIGADQVMKALDSLKKFDIRKDIQKYLYRKGLEQQYNLSVMGGSQAYKYLLSAGYVRNVQNMIGDDNSRASIHWNNEFNPAKWISVNADVIYTQNHSSNNSYTSNYAGTIYPYATLINPDGSPAALDIDWNSHFTDTAGGGQLLDWKLRPLDEVYNSDNTTLSKRLLAALSVNLKMFPHLRLNLKAQYGTTTSTGNDNRNLKNYYTRNLINKFTNLSSSDPKTRYPVPKGGILINTNSNQEIYDFRGQVNYNRRWAEHSISMIAGAEIRQETTERKVYTTFGYNEATLNFEPADLVNQYPTFNDIAGNQYITGGNGMQGYLNRFVSYYSNASYTYKNTYTFSASIRKDQSNLFGVDANQKGVPLWSVGGAWKLSQEHFYDIDWLSYLNLRLTYGKSGNVNNSISSLATIQYIPASRSSIKIPMATIDNYPNPQLRWEKVGMLNAAVDFSAFKDRFNGSLEYYVKKSTDLLNTMDTDPTSGRQTMTVNSASLKGHGFDVTLNAQVINKHVSWQTSFLISYSNYKVIEINYTGSPTNFVSAGNQIFPNLGYNPYAVVSYRWGGLDNEGNPQGYANGSLTTDYSAIRNDSINDQVVSGSALPTYFGNLNNNISYKGFSLAFNISYKLGYYLRKPALSYYDLYYYGRGNKQFSNRWRKSGDEQWTNVPSMIYPANQQRSTFYSFADINVISAANIRLTDIYFKYDLNRILKTSVFSAADIFATMNNLNIVLWKANKEGIDPDFPNGVKPPKNFSLGIRFNL